MGLRTRQREIDERKGYTYNSFNPPVQEKIAKYTFEKVTDDVIVGDNSFFQLERTSCRSGMLMNGTNTAGNSKFSNWPVLGSVTGTEWKPITALVDLTDNEYATRLLAMTNPSRAYVDLPIFIAELKDFPLLFKLIGENAFKTVARSNLAFWFGWAPMVSDMMKMMDFSTIVNKRYKELRHFYDHGLSCTRDLNRISGQDGPTTMFFNGTSDRRVTGLRYQVHSRRIWGHVKWKPTSLPPKTEEEMIALARRAVLGLTIDPVTAWELIPFSWLIDWCSNVGSYLKANRNIIPAMHYDLTIMRHTSTYNSIRRHVPTEPNIVWDGGEVMYEKKHRVPASASLSAHLPYLSIKQLSILGSLWVLKNKSLASRL